MNTIAIDQIEFELQNQKNWILRGNSPGVDPLLIPLLSDILEKYFECGNPEKASGVLFALPLGKKAVVIFQAMGGIDTPVVFHGYLFPRQAYHRYFGDPFQLVDLLGNQVPEGKPLETLQLDPGKIPVRKLAQVREVLQRVKSQALPEDVDPNDFPEMDSANPSESPVLLGGVQVLVDGGKLVFQRPDPDKNLLRALWTLLPNSTRADLWPASFAFNKNLPFDVLVMEVVKAEDFPGYTTEDQAADYPEGRYELSLQVAAESGTQEDLDELLARRSWKETWRLVLTILVLVSVIALATKFLFPTAPRRLSPEQQKSVVASSLVTLTQPLPMTTFYPQAREVWYKIDRQYSN